MNVCFPTVFHLREDAVGKEVLQSSVYNIIPKLLSTMWRIEALDAKAFSSFSATHLVMGSSAFSDSFLAGAIGFAQEFSEYLETQYLTRFGDEGTQCYVRSRAVTPKKSCQSFPIFVCAPLCCFSLTSECYQSQKLIMNAAKIKVRYCDNFGPPPVED